MAPTVIKKYGNRRLYDTGDSKYVTLDELATKIRSGVDVRVIGAEGGEDLTQATLTQIVLEASNAAKFLPVQLLMQMIRLSDDSLAEFFSRYVTSALDIYLGAKRGVQSITGLNPLTQIPVAATDALARMWMGGMSPFQGYAQPGYAGPQPSASFVPAPPPPEPEAEAPPKRESDMAGMRRELDELKQMIRDGLGGGQAKKKRKRSETDDE
ncbi:MAG TPA: polyhydroxyalkanoate synthesis regulator DNA-binding domain-containing protein [Kofleriaceae bacterium]|jgi:polyhydroxyalkanoate synthesis repressor PhaR